MASYILRRFFTAIPVLLLVTVVVFATMQLLPGDPAEMVLGQEATPQALEVMRDNLGLNRPLYEQYLSWLFGVLQGDLGRSMVDNTPVLRAITLALPVTLQISLVALLIALAIGVPLAIVAATRRGGVADWLATLIGLSCISVPGFWVAILLIYLLSLQVSWFPSSGFVRWQDGWVESLHHTLLPAIALSLRPAGIFMRQLRSSMVEVLQSDYIRTARAKGLGKRAVILGHALRTSLIPLVTVLGVEFSALLGNVVVIDTIFSIPGFGRLIYGSLLRLDFVTMQSLVLIFAVSVIAINLLTDIAYSLLDPRIRKE